MDIVLNTRFNNSSLPLAPVPGFFDNFGPAGGPPSDSSLGATSRESRPWDYNVDPWSRTTDQTAMPPGGTRRVAFTNGYSANGTLKTTIHEPASDGQYGLTFRYIDPDNFNYFAFNATLGYFFVIVMVAGERTTIGGVYEPPTAPVTGDSMKVAMQGANIYCYYNETLVLTVVSTANDYATRHGLFDHSPGDQDRTQFSDIEFASN